MSGTTYDPKRLVVTFGAIPITGFDAGDAISVETNGETSTKVGVAGEWAFQESADQSGRVTVRLMATSITNRLLEAHRAAGNLPMPLSCTSLTTGEAVVAGLAKIAKSPNRTFGPEVGTREWVFVSGELTSL